MTTTAWVRANPEKKRAQNIRHYDKIFLRTAAKYLGQATAVKPKLALEENPDG